MREIAISRGLVALVDDEDYESLATIKWFAKPHGKTVYAIHKGKHGNFPMHRKIMNPPKGLEVDHINRNGLDNRRINLRNVTHSMNMLNSTQARLTRGVTFDKTLRRWVVRIRIDGKRPTVGRFVNRAAAQIAFTIVRNNLRQMGRI